MRKTNIFSLLSNEIRQKIINELSKEPLAFAELSRYLNIPSNKLDFHLKKMRGVLVSKRGKKYYLTDMGEAFSKIIQSFESPYRGARALKQILETL